MQAVRQLGDALRQARKRLGLTQSELARRCGLHQPQVAKAEKGDDMLVSSLGELAHALDHELVLVPSSMLDALQERQAGWDPPSVDPNQFGVPGKSLPVRDPARMKPSDYVDVTLKDWAREWPIVPASVFAVIARLMRASQHFERTVGQIAAEAGMSLGEMLVLGALRRIGPPYESSPSRLRENFWITLPGMAKRLGRLERLGMIERVPNPHDRRASVVRLTAKAHALLDASGRRRSPAYDAIIGLPPRERAMLSRLLKRILAQIEGDA